MFLSEMELKNFRNYNLLNLKFSPDVNIFVGQNAQGKTNILEAVALLCIGKSFRSKKEIELINWNQDFCYIKGLFDDLNCPNQVELGFSNHQKKIKINGQNVKKFELFGQVPVVIFSPEDLQIIKGGPQYRRDFIDLYLAQIEPKYRYVYLNYYNILQQRNRFLKEAVPNQTEWEVWDEQLIERGIKVIKYRALLLEKVKPFITEAHQKISAERESLEINYFCMDKYNILELDECLIRKFFKDEIKKVKKLEMERKVTLIGPQRDDIRLTVNDGVELRIFGSQGQQRTAALALKLGMIEIIKVMREKSPLLLLDDVMSEFDDLRKKSLLKMLINTSQTFITSTSLQDFPISTPGSNFYKVEKGAVQNVN